MASVFDKNRLNIFIGAYGSGKSEVSVNCALLLKKNNPDKKVLLADLDIVNPFYRSADAARKLTDSDIRVIYPSYANSNVDAPVLSGEIYVIFDDDSYIGVYDIGGEDMGANVLGSLNNRLNNIEHNLFMVVNTLRPFTSDADSIIVMAQELEAAAKQPITGFVHNTNLLESSTFEDIIRGNDILNEVASKTGVPVVATCYMEDYVKDFDASKLPNSGEIVKLRRTISYNY